MTSTPIRVGIVGFGHIARVQHEPVIAANPGFGLVAIAALNPSDIPAGVPMFHDMDAMFEAMEVDAVALCTPPQISGDLARAAVARGKHVLLEKPPAGTVVEALTTNPVLARGDTMFTA